MCTLKRSPSSAPTNNPGKTFQGYPISDSRDRAAKGVKRTLAARGGVRVAMNAPVLWTTKAVVGCWVIQSLAGYA
jgi:hypothetical protein